MANTVMVKTAIRATNVDSMNKKATATVDMPNGTPVDLTFPTQGDVYKAVKATSGLAFDIGRKEKMAIGNELVDSWLLETTTGGFMVCSPEVNKVEMGVPYGGQDPRYFTNVVGRPMDVIELEKGDVIEVTADFFVTAPVTENTTVTLGATGFTCA